LATCTLHSTEATTDIALYLVGEGSYDDISVSYDSHGGFFLLPERGV